MRRLCQEDWLIERLLVSSDLTEVFYLLIYFPEATLFLSKTQLTHFRWGRKQGLD